MPAHTTYLITAEQVQCLVDLFGTLQAEAPPLAAATQERVVTEMGDVLRRVIRTPAPAPATDADRLLEDTWRRTAARNAPRAERLADLVAFLGYLGQDATEDMNTSTVDEADSAVAGMLANAITAWLLAAHELDQKPASDAAATAFGASLESCLALAKTRFASFQRHRRAGAAALAVEED